MDIYNTWLNRIIVLVQNEIMVKITTNPQLISFAVERPQLDYWVKCFTSPTFDPIGYDTLENIGDTALDMCIDDKAYAMDVFIDADKLSKLKNYYGENSFNARILKNIPLATFPGENFGSFLRVNPEVWTVNSISDAVLGDLYESIMGALRIIGNLFFRSRIGYELCFNWYTYTYKVTNTNFDLNAGNSITVLKQIFDRFKEFKFLNLETKSESTDFTVTSNGVTRVVKGWRYYLPTNAINGLKTLQNTQGIDGNLILSKYHPIDGNKIILVPSNYQDTTYGIRQELSNLFVIGDIDAMAKENAAFQAIKALADYGITPEWATSAKSALEISGSNINQALMNNFMRNLRANGFEKYEFRRPGKISNESANFVQLMGIKANGEQQILLGKAGGGNVSDIKKELFRVFATNPDILTSGNTAYNPITNTYYK